LTQQILEDFKQKVASLQLCPFADGRFEVFLNETRVFSKLETRRFPEYEEIRPALARQGS
jgi:selT/selW/selH-like putative selenoprotein